MGLQKVLSNDETETKNPAILTEQKFLFGS